MIGIDEVGRGAWAGPLLVVAVRAKKNKKLPAGITDSKQLSKKVRERLFPEIVSACDIAEGWVSADVIDEKGLAVSLKSACMLATFQLSAGRKERIIIDGSVDFLADTQYQCVITKIKADETESLVSCASIVAKVLRDQLMREHASEFPEYGFEKNVGYGTQEHRSAIKKFGLTGLHRLSYRPMKDMGN